MKYISSEGLENLKKELEERKTIKRQEIARRLEEAKSLGDLSENTEYSSAKEDQAFNEGKILELEEIIKESILIKPNKNNHKEVQMGSTIKAKLLANSSKKNSSQNQVFIIVGFQEADPINGRISNESPLGKAFLGHKIGDIIEVETPKGKMRYKIIAIK